MNGEKKMKVWVVVGGWSFEGDDLELSGKVFLNKEDGVMYGKSLLKKRYDKFTLKESDVE